MIIKVEVFVDEKEAWRNSKSGTDLTYELWASQYESYRRRLPAFGELLFMKGEAVMRVREANGSLHRKVLTENDPLEFATEHYKFDLIHFQRSSRSMDGKTSLNFFLLGQAPLTVQQAREAAEALAKQFQSDDLTVDVRLDPWFIGSELFPVVYLFQKDSVAPFSKAEYLLRPHVQCSLYDDEMHCK
jgi:hypothetical protein